MSVASLRQCRLHRTHTLWLGPEDGPDAATCVYFRCPCCDRECVAEAAQRWVRRLRPRVVIRRAGDALKVHTEYRPDESVLVRCPASGCGAWLEGWIVGREPEPWRLGTGVVVPLPVCKVVTDDAEGRPS